MNSRRTDDMTTTTKPKLKRGPKPGVPKEPITVYVSDELRLRLGRYLLDKYAGRFNVRNEVILGAIEEKLVKEGY
jgi:hypothetical protein